MVRGFRRHRCYGRDYQSRTPPQGQRDDTEMNRKMSNRFRRFRNTPPPPSLGGGGNGRLLLLLLLDDASRAMRRTVLGRRRKRSCFHQKGKVFLATNLLMGDVLSNEHTNPL